MTDTPRLPDDDRYNEDLWDDDDGLGDDDRCEICGAVGDGCGSIYEACAVCHSPGCPRCLEAWDDVLPYLCDECADRIAPPSDRAHSVKAEG